MWRASCSKRCLVRPVHVAVGTNPAGTLVSYIETEEWLRPTKGAAWHMGRTVFARKRRQQSRSRLARASAKVWPGRQRVTTGTVRRLQSQWAPVSMGQLTSCSCFHQTLKKYLDRQPKARTLRELQAQLDDFVTYYNEIRPHRAIGRRTPLQAFSARVKATPRLVPLDVENYRVRQDRVDKAGKVSLRYRSRLLHIGIGREHKGERVMLLVAGRNIRVVDADGVLICELTIDPERDYQPRS